MSLSYGVSRINVAAQPGPQERLLIGPVLGIGPQTTSSAVANYDAVVTGHGPLTPESTYEASGITQGIVDAATIVATGNYEAIPLVGGIEDAVDWVVETASDALDTVVSIGGTVVRGVVSGVEAVWAFIRRWWWVIVLGGLIIIGGVLITGAAVGTKAVLG